MWDLSRESPTKLAPLSCWTVTQSAARGVVVVGGGEDPQPPISKFWCDPGRGSELVHVTCGTDCWPSLLASTR